MVKEIAKDHQGSHVFKTSNYNPEIMQDRKDDFEKNDYRLKDKVLFKNYVKQKLAKNPEQETQSTLYKNHAQNGNGNGQQVPSQNDLNTTYDPAMSGNFNNLNSTQQGIPKLTS